MRMFLTGEGPTDCGRSNFDEKKGQFIWEEGPVQVYIHKAAPDLQIDTFDKHQINNLSATRKNRYNRRSMQGLSGHREKAFFIAKIAAEQGYNIIAMYVDADKSTGSTQKNHAACQKRYDLVKGEVLDGLQRGGAAKPLPIVPMKMIECWILGDRNAFIGIYGRATDPAQFKNPELLWGSEDNPQSDYPKNRLDRILVQCGGIRSQETFVSIAEKSDLQTVCETCPISFADFIGQLKALI